MIIEESTIKELMEILNEYANDDNYRTYEVDLGYVSNGHAATNTYDEFDGDSPGPSEPWKFLVS